MANYVVCGKLSVQENAIINGTISDVRSLSGLVKKLQEGGYRDVMELTDNKRVIKELNVDNLILINFECADKSDLCISGTTTTLNMEVID
tara:strand:+ start:3323 stop:3592 length:270 start_codon:yes stop_codon:yes gene_type:complete